MNAKTWVPLTLALVLGLAAALVARQMMVNKPAAQASDKLLRTVVFANENILPGTEINPAMLTTAQVSGAMAADDTFTDVSDLADRVAQGPIYKGQPVMGKLLAPKGSPGGFGTLIPTGMRAITIEVNEFSGVAGFLTPGCRVDVLATVQGDQNGVMVSQTIVQNIMVTAIGQRLTVQ
jgi:pilus assembly protein CpaB